MKVASVSRSANGLWGKWKFELPRRRVNTIARFLTVRIDVGKPADAAGGHGLEILAVIIQELIISLLIADAGDRVWALGFYIRNSRIGRWPTVLRSGKGGRSIYFAHKSREKIFDVPRQGISSFPHHYR